MNYNNNNVFNNINLNNNQNKSFRTTNSNYSTYLSNFSQSPKKESKYITIINDLITNKNTEENSINLFRKETINSNNFSIPSNQNTIDSMIDDMRFNVIEKREKEKTNLILILNKLEENIKNLTENLNIMKNEENNINVNLKEIEKENKKLLNEYERIKEENFYINIEKVYLEKKIKDKKMELNDVKFNLRNNHYKTFKNIANNLVDINHTKLNKNNIDQLIEEKKCLKTAILILNKKINNLKKDLAMKIFKGEVFIEDFNRLINNEKNEININEN